MKRLKNEGLKTIIEEKSISIDGHGRQIPDIWPTIKARKFDIFKKPWGPYILIRFGNSTPYTVP